MKIEHMHKLPWDIDEDHHFQMKCTKDQWVDKSEDERWFNMHTSSRKGLNGKRKTRHCIGSLFCVSTQVVQNYGQKVYAMQILENLEERILTTIVNVVAIMLNVSIVAV